MIICPSCGFIHRASALISQVGWTDRATFSEHERLRRGRSGRLIFRFQSLTHLNTFRLPPDFPRDHRPHLLSYATTSTEPLLDDAIWHLGCLGDHCHMVFDPADLGYTITHTPDCVIIVQPIDWVISHEFTRQLQERFL